MSEMRIVCGTYRWGKAKYIDNPETKVLKIDNQNGEAVMWALVDPWKIKSKPIAAFTPTGYRSKIPMGGTGLQLGPR